MNFVQYIQQICYIHRKVGQTMAFSLHGVKVPHRKKTVGVAAEKLPTPSTVILPTAMHIGAPAAPVVKVGDHVDIGTLVAQHNGAVSSPVYASVSGTVKKIEDYLTNVVHKMFCVLRRISFQVSPF